MTLYLVRLIVSFNLYRWIVIPIKVVEKENAFIVKDTNDEETLKLLPTLIQKNRVNIVLASRLDSIREISLSIYCIGSDITEAKDKLITEITKLSSALLAGLESRKKVLDNITHENQ